MTHVPPVSKARIIPTFQGSWESGEWQQIMRGAVRTTQDLLNTLGLEDVGADLDPQFKVRVPAPYLARIQANAPNDPILLQVLPQLAERQEAAGFATDALDEASFVATPSLLQKYDGRALIIVTQACAVHCRYCFRRSFPYGEHRASQHDAAIEHIRQDPSIREVILSGGDPLAIDDVALSALLRSLDNIDHVERIRLHTRLPIVLPQRITHELVTVLEGLRAKAVIVVHTNHANELDALTARALKSLTRSGATLLNQTVLLRGINDAWTVQKELAEALFAQGVLPYYLHLPDHVTGTHHFMVTEQQARPIMEALHARLPGYLVPRLVQEIPGKTGKTPIFWTTGPANSL